MGDQHYWRGVHRQRIGRRRLLGTATAGVAAIGAVAIGCGDDDDDEGQAPSPGGSPAAAAQPKRGGTFASSRTNEVPHLDVHQATTVTLAGVGPGMSYSRLMALKLGPEGLAKNKVVPQGDVVERWEQPDDRTYVFKLRPGVKFFNIAPVNGRELVAEDIVYSFKRQQDLKFTASFLGPVEKVEATDRQTVLVTLSRPDNDQLVIFATNFPPEELIDPAQLRRVHYKMKINPPSAEEYREIFQRICASYGLEFSEDIIAHLLNTFYIKHKVPFAGFHQKFIAEHVIAACNYLGTPPRITRQLLADSLENMVILPASPSKE